MRSRPHPRGGGTEGYDEHHRQDILNLVLQGFPHGSGSRRSIGRWTANGVQALQKSGGPERKNFVGIDALLLVLYRMAWPEATADEVSAFMFTHSPRRAITGLYDRAAVTRAEQRLGLTRKIKSTTANQAFTPNNLMRRHLFWTQPYPVGVAGENVLDLIDVDEAAITLGAANRKYAKGPRNVRVRSRGVYGHGDKFTLILAVSPLNGSIFYTFEEVPGTDIPTYDAFIQQCCARLPLPGNQNWRSRLFMHDNLSSHLNPQITNTVLAAGHRVIARPPYRPCDGPIEWIFNQVQQELARRMFVIITKNDLRREVGNIIQSLTAANILATFTRCGY
jgi:hypothetical protein